MKGHSDIDDVDRALCFHIITVFPEFYSSPLSVGLLKKAQERGIVSFNFVDLKKFGVGKHRFIDDRPYGGGAGMIIRPELVLRAIESVKIDGERKITILFSPSGYLLTQSIVKRIYEYENIVLICPRYEGVDERVKKYVDIELSIGDYVVHSGDVAALVLIEAILRLKEGFMSSPVEEEISFNLLDFPHFTHPRDFEGEKVPDVLLSGNHSLIRKWRIERSVQKTLERRPDLVLKTLCEMKKSKKTENLDEFISYLFDVVFGGKNRDKELDTKIYEILLTHYLSLEIKNDPFGSFD